MSTDKALDKFVEHLTNSVISEITEKLPEIVKTVMYEQMENVYKTQRDIQNDFGHFRDDLKDFDKRLSDLQIIADTIDSKATQIKVTQDKQPKHLSKTVVEAVSEVVESTVPDAVASVVEPFKDTLKTVPRKTRGFNFLFWRGGVS